jgi:hypothetical protein
MTLKQHSDENNYFVLKNLLKFQYSLPFHLNGSEIHYLVRSKNQVIVILSLVVVPAH